MHIAVGRSWNILRLPRLRVFSVLFSQLYGKCQGIPLKDGARPALFLISELCFSMYCLCRLSCSMYSLCRLCCSTYVLLACKCLLYYCHRVSIQLQLNISYLIDHIISYIFYISYYIVSYLIICHVISYSVSYHIISYRIVSYQIISYIISYYIVLYHISYIPYNIIIYHIARCRDLAAGWATGESWFNISVFSESTRRTLGHTQCHVKWAGIYFFGAKRGRVLKLIAVLH